VVKYEKAMNTAGIQRVALSVEESTVDDEDDEVLYESVCSFYDFRLNL
jgi:hypothetical protein